MIAETKRLRLREISIADAAFVLELVSEPSFREGIGDKGLRNLADARRFIQEGAWTCQERSGYGQFLVELKEGGQPAGICGLLYRQELDVSDIGFAFLARFRRRGYAYEAAQAVMKYGRSDLGIDKIVGLTSRGNQASINMLEKLGMEFEQTVKMSDDDPGTLVYS